MDFGFKVGVTILDTTWKQHENNSILGLFEFTCLIKWVVFELTGLIKLVMFERAGLIKMFI